MTAEKSKDYVRLLSQILTPIIVGFGVTKVSDLEKGISRLNGQMATVIERTVNFNDRIRQNESRIQRLERMRFERED